MYFIEPLLGNRIFLAKIEPKTMVIAPAIINLAPASVILDAVSSAGILKRLYAILMAGDALPHNTQQKSAVKNVIGRYAQMLFFCSFITMSPKLIYSAKLFYHDDLDILTKMKIWTVPEFHD
jgi:hypothetical protein